MVKNSFQLMMCTGMMLMAMGCGGAGDRPPVATVTGTVTKGGIPIPMATVQFFPQSGRPSSAMTNESGEFNLIYMQGVEGAVIGKHSVSIIYGGTSEPAAPNSPTKRPKRVSRPKKGSMMQVVKMPQLLEVLPDSNDFQLTL